MERRTKADWKELVKEYRNSGKSLKVWCEEKGINYKTMCGHTHLVPVNNAKRSEKEWIDLINEKRASGMSREGWCREKGVNPNSMLSAEKRLNDKLSPNNTDLIKQPCATQEDVIDGSGRKDTNAVALTVSDKSGWIEVDISERPEAKPLPKQNGLTTIVPEISFNEIGEGVEDELQKAKLCSSKITIRCGKLTIEADAGYPSEYLENIIGKLAEVC